jgi:hypothetical protein
VQLAVLVKMDLLASMVKMEEMELMERQVLLAFKDLLVWLVWLVHR